MDTNTKLQKHNIQEPCHRVQPPIYMTKVQYDKKIFHKTSSVLNNYRIFLQLIKRN